MNKNDRLVEGIKQYSSQIGGYAGEYTVPISSAPFAPSIREQKLVASCDGVGTKILLAQQAKKTIRTIIKNNWNRLCCNGC